MKLHPNYIKELKEKYKDQEYTGSDWEKADKRNYHRFDTYTQSWYKISSLPENAEYINCLLYTSPSPRDLSTYRMPCSG